MHQQARQSASLIIGQSVAALLAKRIELHKGHRVKAATHGWLAGFQLK